MLRSILAGRVGSTLPVSGNKVELARLSDIAWHALPAHARELARADLSAALGLRVAVTERGRFLSR